MRTPYQVSSEVAEALATNKPVVALESTILCHGMPYPSNVRTAVEVENIIRSRGAVPATIALIGGRPHIGLTEREIEMLGKEGHNVKKVSRRDLAFVVANKLHGATTVSATMLLAHLAGIKVSFARKEGAALLCDGLCFKRLTLVSSFLSLSLLERFSSPAASAAFTAAWSRRGTCPLT